MKKVLYFMIFAFSILFLNACNNDPIAVTINTPHNPIFPEECTCSQMSMMIDYQDFETTLLASDNIVVAQLVERRPFGGRMEELEFVVIEQLHGYTNDRIFIYLHRNTEISVISNVGISDFRESDFEFEKDVDYLLSLRMVDSIISNFQEHAYFLMTGAPIVNLDEPTESIMFNEPLAYHATELDFSDSDLFGDDVINFVAELVDEYLVADEAPKYIFNNVRSNDLATIINYSQIVVEVEINELLDSYISCYRAVDWFRVTIVNSLKGDFEVGYYFKTNFFMDTVNTGERYMTLRPGTFQPLPGTGLAMHRQTSRNGVISRDYLDVVRTIIRNAPIRPVPMTQNLNICLDCDTYEDSLVDDFAFWSDEHLYVLIK